MKNISPHIITFTTKPEVSKQTSERVLVDLTECEKIAVIGDIHGTLKFIKGYEHILKHNDDVSKIVVLGDHFDPYGSVDFETMVERYNTFISCMKMDNRIVSILGKHYYPFFRYSTWIIMASVEKPSRLGSKAVTSRFSGV